MTFCNRGWFFVVMMSLFSWLVTVHLSRTRRGFVMRVFVACSGGRRWRRGRLGLRWCFTSGT